MAKAEDKKSRLELFKESTEGLEANKHMKKKTTSKDMVVFTSKLPLNIKKTLVMICAINELQIQDVLTDLVTDWVKGYDQNGHRIDK